MTAWAQRLLIANVVIFFLQQTMTGLTGQLAFVPALALSRPWTMVTYMFVHGGLMHILFNMLGLYFFGPRVEERLGAQRFVTLYFVSGIAGALLSFLFAPLSPIIGASGAVFGVMLAYARFWPRDQVMIWGIIPVEIRFLVIFYTALSLLGIGGGVAHMAHLGGFVGAFVYLQIIARNPAQRRFKRQLHASPEAETLLGNWRRVDPRRVHEVNRDEVNRILDKISAQGLASLTPQERQFLVNFVPPDDRPRQPPVS